MTIDPATLARLDGSLESDLAKDGRLGKVRRYLKGDHDKPYMPRGAKAEYAQLGNRSITNWTPLLSDTYAKGLFVDGYRASKASDNAAPWSYWQANGLDARQSIAHRGALNYGASYALVLPGTLGAKRVPVLRPLSPLRSSAWYRDLDDEFPELAIQRKGTTTDGTRLVEAYDATSVYTYALPKPDKDSSEPPKWILSRTDEHGLGVVPFVRFRDRLDDDAVGIIAPILPLQDRINEIVFSTLIAIQYASFRQRWATGLAIPEDDDGNAVEPFRAAVDRLWVAEDPGAKFGDFAQTELSGHAGAYDSTVRTLASISQINPNLLIGSFDNLGADALKQMESSTRRKREEYETLFGESWEQAFRLAAKAAGDNAGAADTAAQVRWRDTEDYALSQTVDALGKMAQMLTIPVEALWERIPGVTDQDVERWQGLREADPLAELTAELSRQAGGAGDLATADTPAAEDPVAVKAKADALGSLIRSGVDPESAATKVGLLGVEFTGAVPVSLRLPASEADDVEDK